MRFFDVKQATIKNGASISGVVDLEAYKAIGFLMPASWTAADLYFTACDTPDGTFLPIFDNADNEFVVDAEASQALAIVPTANILGPFRYIQICSGPSTSRVTQGADRLIKVLVRDPEFEE